MPRNRQERREARREQRVPDRVDNPTVRSEPRPQAEVKSPRSYKGSDFRNFPRLVVQLGRPRPRREGVGGGGTGRRDQQTGTDPKEGFARPLRGMGMGRYEGFRDSAQPEISAYRTAVHDAYADGTITPEEQKALRQQRHGLRRSARQYRNEHPLQMGLGARVKQMAQGERDEGIGDEVNNVARSPDVVSGQKVGNPLKQPWPGFAGGPSYAGGPKLSLENLRQLQERWKSGEITPQEVLAALGFTGELPNG